MRLLPEIIGFFNKKADNSHELAMLDRQVALEQAKSAARLAEIQAGGAIALQYPDKQNDSAETLAALAAQGVALQSQMQLTKIRWVDALNFSVRPITTYYMLILYGLAKVAMFMVAVKSGLGGWESILKVYDEEDRAILSGILAFWYTSRVLEKRRGD